MYKGAKGKLPVLGVVLSLLCLSGLLFSAENSRGNIVGFVYEKDGTTPLEGAVVKFKNLASGIIYESSKSDIYGLFKLQGVDSGIYFYGVETSQGSFNADNIVGLRLKENETAKLSIAISPYGKEEAAAVQEIYKDLERSGEAFVGTILAYNPNTQLADVEIIRGLLKKKDKIHTKGQSTDFYQGINIMMANNNSVGQLVAGQTGSLKLEQKAHKGDLIYVVQDRRVFPFMAAPLGAATVLAGTSAFVITGKIEDRQEPTSPCKNK